jgi:hypothetical protein
MSELLHLIALPLAVFMTWAVIRELVGAWRDLDL